ncbi:MAG: pitrilysin family protein [Acidobacteriota bacterium]
MVYVFPGTLPLSIESPGAGPAPATEISLDVCEEILDNGLRLLMDPDPKSPTVSFMTFVDAGARDELKPGTTGLAHVFEHMMFRGTKRFPNYDETLAPLGPELNASTSQDMTTYYVNVPSSALEKVIDVESDRFQNMTFTNETFRTELGTVREERRRSHVDSPTGTLYSRLYELAYQVHPYHHPVIGWEEDLEKNMTYEDGLEFYRTYYSPKRTVLVVSGGFDVSWLRDQVREHYDAWKRQPEPDLEVPREPPQKEERRDCIIWKDDQVTPKMMVGYHGPEMSLDAPDYCVLDVISQLLFMRSQRLAKRLYTNLQLVESISGWITGSKDPNLFIIYASLKKGGTTAKVLEIVDEELEQLRGEKVSERELVKAKNALAASMLYSLDRPYAVARSLGFHQIAGGDYRLLMRIEARYQTITRADVQNVAQRIFRAANRTVVELLPKSSAQST